MRVVRWLKSFIFVGALWATVVRALPSVLEGMDIANSASHRVDLKTPQLHVIIFLSAQCPCSASHEPLLAQLSTDFPSISFTAIHSNANEDPALSRKYFAAAKLPFPVLRDEGARWADEFGALKTPHAFVMRSGEILYSGGVTNSTDGTRANAPYLREALTALLTGKTIDQRERRALGCVIARP